MIKRVLNYNKEWITFETCEELIRKQIGAICSVSLYKSDCPNMVSLAIRQQITYLIPLESLASLPGKCAFSVTDYDLEEPGSLVIHFLPWNDTEKDYSQVFAKVRPNILVRAWRNLKW